MKRRLEAFAAAVFLVLSAATGVFAQNGLGRDPSPLQATRAQLEEMLKAHEQSAQSRAYSPKLRERARYEAGLIRQRLNDGDFQVGDRISLIVEGEPTLSDTLVVTPEITVLLPSRDTVSLRKVLRSELHPILHEAIVKVVRDPSVRTETYLRVGVFGAVGTQGFLELRSDALLTDVLNRVGIPGGAQLDKMKIERDKKTIWEGEPLRDALSEGRTLDQLSLRAGDIINVPALGTGGKNIFQSARSVLMIVPIFYALRRVFNW